MWILWKLFSNCEFHENWQFTMWISWKLTIYNVNFVQSDNSQCNFSIFWPLCDSEIPVCSFYFSDKNYGTQIQTKSYVMSPLGTEQALMYSMNVTFWLFPLVFSVTNPDWRHHINWLRKLTFTQSSISTILFGI